MSFVELIEAKKSGRELDEGQIRTAVSDYTGGRIPDYQMAAFLMAVRWRGLSDEETAALTRAMIESGERYDLSDLTGPAVDKHSTGGVGDKVSLALAPLAAACGCIVPMVSGRGLGHTGGTLDKLESIPGFRTGLERAEFLALLADLGVVMAAATETFVPADRKLYALRDVTATVDEPGLITASILSKKAAEGARGLVMDVKVGSGAFLPRREPARALADRLVRVADALGIRCSALLSDMDRPLGVAVGNGVEVAEAIECLQGGGPPELRELVLELAAEMLVMGGLEEDRDTARRRAVGALDGGDALERFAALVERQGGDPRVVDEPERLPRAASTLELIPERSGIVQRIDARRVGLAALAAGAGRETLEDDIDPGAGVLVHASRGDEVDGDRPWATLVHADDRDPGRSRALLESALTIGDEAPEATEIVLERRP